MQQTDTPAEVLTVLAKRLERHRDNNALDAERLEWSDDPDDRRTAVHLRTVNQGLTSAIDEIRALRGELTIATAEQATPAGARHAPTGSADGAVCDADGETWPCVEIKRRAYELVAQQTAEAAR